MSVTVPPGIGSVANAEDLFFGGTGNVHTTVNIYNADGSLWLAGAPIESGNVSVDYTRAERRTFDLSFDNGDDTFQSDPENFWYDKIIKVFRGVQDDDGNVQTYQLGEFLIDRIEEASFPPTVQVSGRDLTKRMMLSRFATATAYAAGVPIATVINGLAVASGITRVNLASTGTNLSAQFMYEAGASRWEAASALAEAHSMELFFDRTGILTMRPFVDPTTAPVQFSFLTGAEGNLSSYTKSTNDSQIFNHILVTGTSSVQLPVAASAENNEPSSPTRIERLGRRTYVYDSKLIATSGQAQTLADSLLKIMALESFDLSLSALVAPWLDVGAAIEFVDPNPAPYAPTSFLLTQLSVPLEVGGLMDAEARRVTIVS